MTPERLELSSFVARVGSRWRTHAALRAWAPAALSAAVVLGLARLAHSMVSPGPMLAGMLWAAAFGGALVCLAWGARHLPPRPATARVARFVEERCPELEDALATATAVLEDPEPGLVGRAVIDDAARRTRGLDLERVVSRDGLWAQARRAAGATLALVVALAFSAQPAVQASRTVGSYLFPSHPTFDVTPGNVQLRAGQPLTIRVQVAGGPPGIAPVLRVAGPAGWRDQGMTRAADGFIAAFTRVDEGFDYAVAVEGAETRGYTVTVIRPARIERIDLRYEYPRALAMEPRDERDGGDIYGPVGTRVHLAVHTDKPVAEGTLALTGGQPVTMTADGRVLEGELTITADGSYRIALIDVDGLGNPGDSEYFIRTLEDRPPEVRITRPSSDRSVTPVDEVIIEARADDDVAIATLDLVFSVRGGKDVVVPFQRTGDGPSVEGRRTLYLEELGVAPGDFVTYYARTTDAGRGKRPSEARSDLFFLDITPFTEEFVASQSQGGGGPEEASIAELVDGQKQVITATWKLDRRARNSGGRSAEDVRAVAVGQGELRRRLVGTAVQMRRAAEARRRRPRGRAATPESNEADALGKAADAMGAAQQRLVELSTSRALPQEMIALNELLRAQAETRRREIQNGQQTASDGRGSGRQQQDLSSLFDRELAREQRTNYETAPPRPDQPGPPDALERVRELARRQEQLNREQQDLAAARQGMSADEVKRQIERLMREQTELREQVEELARRQSGDAGRSMQEVASEMQRAASELRRQDPQQASERGGRALEQLREAEQRVRAGMPDERRRALGDLQIESRQLADAQRDVAGSAAATPEGARRRAAEQERLADRMRRVEEAVKQMSQDGQGDEAQRRALSDVARALEGQPLSARMQSLARDQARQAASLASAPEPKAGANEAQQIAREIDRLADGLSAAASNDAAGQQLSEQLADVREMRETLSGIDRELSDPSRPGEAPWQAAREFLERASRQIGYRTPEANGFNPGRSAPGTEGWKQDYAAWDVLKVQLAAALDLAESRAAAQLRNQRLRDRLSAGARRTAPDQYRRLVDQYYRALASPTERK